MILVDTSAWVEFFRGPGLYADMVDELLESNRALLCGPVLTEIRRGLGRGRARDEVLLLLSGCSVLAQPAELWSDAGDLGAIVRRKGATIKTMDLLKITFDDLRELYEKDGER